MSSIPLLFSEESQRLWMRRARSRGPLGKLTALSRFRPRHFKPVVGLELGLTDPVSGLNMGQTAEVLAREFQISREAQDQFALRSHQRAAAAWSEGRMAPEVMPVPISPRYENAADRDTGIDVAPGLVRHLPGNLLGRLAALAAGGKHLGDLGR